MFLKSTFSSLQTFRPLFLRILPKNFLIFTFLVSKILMTFFFFYSSTFFLPFSTLVKFCVYLISQHYTPFYTHTCSFTRFYNSLSTLITMNASECCIHHLFLLKSSLHKQPFITAHFRSSLHILCITAH